MRRKMQEERKYWQYWVCGKTQIFKPPQKARIPSWPVFLRKHSWSASDQLVCRGFVTVYAVLSPAQWEGTKIRTQATSFSCAPNYYSILFLVKSGRAFPLFWGGPELDLLWPKVLQLNNTSIYSGHFVFRLIHSVAKLNVLQHRQNTFRLSIKRISDISALIRSCSNCPEAMRFAI